MEIIMTIVVLIVIAFDVILIKQNNDIKKRLNNIDKK